jgi:phosphohistidine phosphatase
MEVYLIRHAAAQPLGQKNDFTDEKRTLTAEGRERMREAAKGLRKIDVEFDLILTSPLVRAVETAEIIAAALGYDKKLIEQITALAPGGSHEKLISNIKSHSGAESIALVGHQPDLGQFASRITGCGSEFGVDLKKGSVCCINVAETVPALRGGLVWMMTTKQLRMLAKA